MVAILSWALVISWMALIFFLSAQHADQSADLSGGITELVNKVVEQVAPEAELHIDEISFFVRKNAHFFAYMLLVMLTLNAVRRSGGHGWLSIGLAFVITVLYAISDEVHQLYVPGRSGQVSDVVLDSTGAVVGIALYLVISHRNDRKQKVKNRDREN
ncbi:VanZ family protein [Bacillus sp. CHD6a]|nr:VanZ family protein [Bacillus sp. CHD6a]